MRFAQAVVLILPLIVPVFADRHGRCWCGYKDSDGAGGGWHVFRDATNAACDRYKNRNTGTKPWDTCPDCTTTDGADKSPFTTVAPCHSPAGHLGGDEFTYYCEQVSGDRYTAYCKA